MTQRRNLNSRPLNGAEFPDSRRVYDTEVSACEYGRDAASFGNHLLGMLLALPALEGGIQQRVASLGRYLNNCNAQSGYAKYHGQPDLSHILDALGVSASARVPSGSYTPAQNPYTKEIISNLAEIRDFLQLHDPERTVLSVENEIIYWDRALTYLQDAKEYYNTGKRANIPASQATLKRVALAENQVVDTLKQLSVEHVDIFEELEGDALNDRILFTPTEVYVPDTSRRVHPAQRIAGGADTRSESVGEVALATGDAIIKGV